jgi:hypothetical protein
MKGDLSARSARDLMQILAFASNLHEDARQEIELTIYQRWRDGIDLEPLIDLLKSETKHDQLNAAFYLIDVVPRHETILDLATGFAGRRLSYCRKAFVGYITNTGRYNDAIAVGLANCLRDTNTFVRAETINWAVYTTDDRFDDFSLRIKVGPDPKGHCFRALEVARMLREGERIAAVRRGMSDKDSLVFDYLQIFEKRLMRYVARRRSEYGIAIKTSEYDEFEIGVMGEAYDNLGMVKGRQPSGEVPEHVTDVELDNAIDRLKESSNHRKLDQRAIDMARRE